MFFYMYIDGTMILHFIFCSDFVQFYNNIHGNCFIFNSGWNQSLAVLNTTRTGSRYGTTLYATNGHKINVLCSEHVEQRESIKAFFM